ncbi:ORF_101R [Scale drop disease virus]|uniref:ORF_101R n=1 Tax=Scale drop disease virus TaxID=1697349 RepID=A0A0K1L6B2_9VIRU|nr:ORF_101R [Scale drop disease virus]AKU37516.1 ORF_101R [Scale drop disease virus]
MINPIELSPISSIIRAMVDLPDAPSNIVLFNRDTSVIPMNRMHNTMNAQMHIVTCNTFIKIWNFVFFTHHKIRYPGVILNNFLYCKIFGSCYYRTSADRTRISHSL